MVLSVGSSMTMKPLLAPRLATKRRRVKTIATPPGPSFVAIDFETANRFRDSACAVSAVSVVDGTIAQVFTTLIRPTSSLFEFTNIHGITFDDVRDSPSFRDIAPQLLDLLSNAPFIAAHNSSFDSSVVNALCEIIDEPSPPTPWLCTVRLARRTWRLPRCGLADVSHFLDIPLNHHEAESDARACASIVLAALDAAAGKAQSPLR